MKKPAPTAIRAAMALSAQRPPDPLSCCNLCGKPSEWLGVWREHGEHDEPLPGDQFLVYIAKDHADCMRRMEKHPRLYARVFGRPGQFPLLCGPCVHRDGMGCLHPDQTSMGGTGLLVTPDIGFNVIICSRGSREKLVRTAVACKGRQCAS
jgi:hypothetical protein